MDNVAPPTAATITAIFTLQESYPFMAGMRSHQPIAQVGSFRSLETGQRTAKIFLILVSAVLGLEEEHGSRSQIRNTCIVRADDMAARHPDRRVSFVNPGLL